MQLLKWLGLSLVALIIALVAVGLLLPSSRHVERSITIDAPPCVVFATVNSFHRFDDWSPIAEVMPDASSSLIGPAFGIGAGLSWTTPGPDGDSGSQVIVSTIPEERVDLALDLGREGAAQGAYLLQPEGAGTRLTWSFDVDLGLDLIARFRALRLDRSLGPLYAQGLANLKSLCEGLPKVDWSDIEIGLGEVRSATIAYAPGTCDASETAIAGALATAFGQVVRFVAANELQLAGHPLAITNYSDERGWSFEAGLPVAGQPARGVGAESTVRMGETYGGRVVRAVHIGPYRRLQETYAKAEAFIAVYGLGRNGRPWDVFISDPGSTPEAELRTEVHYPVE